MRLFLLRHARAEVGTDRDPDALRPLSAEGRRDAARVGDWLAARPESPALVRCSTARRALETMDRALSGLTVRPRTVASEDLYLASAWKLFEIACATEAGVRSQMLVGHNPGMAELAARLARRGRGDPASFGRLARAFPPATVAEIELPGDRWDELNVDEGGVLVAHFLA